MASMEVKGQKIQHSLKVQQKKLPTMQNFTKIGLIIYYYQIIISDTDHPYLISLTLSCSLLNVQSQPQFEKRMMYNISVTWESIQFIDTEHIFSKSNTDPTLLLVSIVGYFLILATNISLIKFILSQSSKTFLDMMMVFDSVLCICNVITIAYIVAIEQSGFSELLFYCSDRYLEKKQCFQVFWGQYVSSRSEINV